MLDCKLELCHLLCFKDTMQVLDITVVLVWYYKALGTFTATAATKLPQSICNVWGSTIIIFHKNLGNSCLYTCIAVTVT